MTEAVLDRRTLRSDVFAAVEALRGAGAFVPDAEKGLDSSRPDSDSKPLVWFHLPGPRVEPRALLALLGEPSAAGEPDAVVWENAEESFAGWGVASSIRVDDGAARFERVRREIESVAVRCFGLDGRGSVRTEHGSPRWFGGFAFEDGPIDDSSPWRGFGAGWFMLPRLSIQVVEDRAEWGVVIDAAEAERPAEAEAVTLLSWLWDRIEAGLGATPKVTPLDSARSFPKAPQRFAQSIGEAVESIRQGALEKVVAASHVDVPLDLSPPLDQLMESWSDGAVESTRFLFRRGGAAFLGATPERLIRKTGRRVETGALAGTAPKETVHTSDHSTDVAGAARARVRAGRRVASQLLASSKNRSEHDFVVRHLVENLEPLCSSLHVSDDQSILELRDLLHLQTPIEGQLQQDRHVLELVEALHPTPAVCGFPTESARQWIEDHEEVRRGWYSGPVGWLDGAGDGDFQVALRSMLLSFTDGQGTPETEPSGYRRARLYAGVGLVLDSRIPEEMNEVDAKLLTAGRALGPWIRDEPWFAEGAAGSKDE